MRLSPVVLALALAASPLRAQDVPCGGPFADFVAGLKAEAVALGADLPPSRHSSAAFARTRRCCARIGTRATSSGTSSIFHASDQHRRLDRGRSLADRHDAIFDRIEAEFGVPRGVLLAFWAFETDFGAVQGDFNTANAIVTLAHDCRRPALFRPEVFAAITLFQRGDFDPASTTGAWAGEIGQVQMLPADILDAGLDGDGDGHVRLKSSAEDALLSGAHMLSRLGWRPGEPWLTEIVVPADLDWRLTGLDKTRPVSAWQELGVVAREGNLGDSSLAASVLLPMGRHGPAFLAYANFRIYFEWNQSLTYVTTAAYFRQSADGCATQRGRQPRPWLTGDEMLRLQERLAARGHDVGAIDGILGARTRVAVQAEQARLGLPADACQRAPCWMPFEVGPQNFSLKFWGLGAVSRRA